MVPCVLRKKAAVRLQKDATVVLDGRIGRLRGDGDRETEFR
jgi:hypothetical protein